MRIGLFFGSFNPIHIGHLVIANYIREYTDLDKIWFVVSPQNPFKKKSSLLENYERLELVHRAIGDSARYEASSIEFGLSQPSYTIDTLVHLREKHPNHTFALIMGSDNLEYFHKWKNFEIILRDYELIIYPRPTYDFNNFQYKAKMQVVDAPLMDISSSLIRKMFHEGKNPEFLLPKDVYTYIEEMSFYKSRKNISK